MAAELISQGVKTTDIIVVCSRQHSEQTVVVLGILMVASIVAPIDPDVSHDECFYCIQKMKPKMVFCDVRVMGQIELVLTELNLSKSCQVREQAILPVSAMIIINTYYSLMQNLLSVNLL